MHNQKYKESDDYYWHYVPKIVCSHTFKHFLMHSNAGGNGMYVKVLCNIYPEIDRGTVADTGHMSGLLTYYLKACIESSLWTDNAFLPQKIYLCHLKFIIDFLFQSFLSFIDIIVNTWSSLTSHCTGGHLQIVRWKKNKN